MIIKKYIGLYICIKFYDIICIGRVINNMEINIRGDKLKVTDAIRNHITEKLGKLDKYFGADAHIRCSVVIKVKDKDQIIEVTIPTDKFTLRAEEKHADLYAATDLVVDKLEGQIRKHKAKLKKYKTFAPVINDTTDIVDEPEEKIVKRKILEIKPMDEEEAILQMELIDHDFFVFINEDTHKQTIVYLRRDGGYGVIEAKN